MPEAQLIDFRMHYEFDDYLDPWVPGDVMVLHHGYCRNGKLWYPWVPLLVQKYRVLRPDARGFGQSSVPPAGYKWSIAQLAEDVISLLDRLRIEKVIYVGESSGGIIGMQLALTHPERMKALVLVNTPCRLPQREGAGGPDAERMMIERGVEAYTAATINTRFDTRFLSPEAVQWRVSEMGKTTAAVAQGYIAAIRSADFSGNLKHIQVPALLLASELNATATLEQQKFMKKQLPTAKLVVFKGVGSGIHVFMPRRCVQAVERFLKGVATD